MRRQRQAGAPRRSHRQWLTPIRALPTKSGTSGLIALKEGMAISQHRSLHSRNKLGIWRARSRIGLSPRPPEAVATPPPAFRASPPRSVRLKLRLAWLVARRLHLDVAREGRCAEGCGHVSLFGGGLRIGASWASSRAPVARPAWYNRAPPAGTGGAHNPREGEFP